MDQYFLIVCIVFTFQGLIASKTWIVDDVSAVIGSLGRRHTVVRGCFFHFGQAGLPQIQRFRPETEICRRQHPPNEVLPDDKPLLPATLE